jgi:hypothetical protein
MSENRVSISLSPEQQAILTNSFNSAAQILNAVCISLTAEDRQEFHKMGPKSVSFVSSAVQHAQQNPKFVPGFVDVPELAKDVDAVVLLNQLLNLVAPLCKQLEDTILLAGSEAYSAALSFYKAVGDASKKNVPGAEVVYTDLKSKLPQAKPRKPKDSVE